MIDAVMAGAVRGFGPYEMSFTIGLAGELAASWTVRRRYDGLRAASYETKIAGQDHLVACAADLYDMVSSVTPEGSPDRAALNRVVFRATVTSRDGCTTARCP